jgi:Transposase
MTQSPSCQASPEKKKVSSNTDMLRADTVGSTTPLDGWHNISITRNTRKALTFAVGCDCSHANLAKRSAFMSQEKYVGMDVHQATISVAVMDAAGKLITECLLETKASTIVEFIGGLQGSLSLSFEEGTSAAWLHDLLEPHVSRLVVCDPRKNALLKDGRESDRIDACKVAELLRTNQLNPVYHGEHGVRTLKELGRSYLALTKDGTHVMNRIKALCRSWVVPRGGATVYAPRHRAEWLAKIVEPGVRVRAEHLYQQFDGLQPLRLRARFVHSRQLSNWYSRSADGGIPACFTHNFPMRR